MCKEIKTTFADFMDGNRMIMLIHRGKEGGKNDRGDRVSKRKISKNKEEFVEIVKEFLVLKAESDKPLRIYSAVNKRDIDKAIREFKQRQLDSDYYDEDSRQGFYLDIKNRWISCVMSPKCRAETKFIIDIDDGEDDIDFIKEKLELLSVKILLEYKTKNGTHIITEPFNPNLLPEADINKDGLLLLDF